MSLAPSGRIKFLVTGARGATFADVARGAGSFGALPSDSDSDVNQKFADYAIQKNPGFKGDRGETGGSNNTFFNLDSLKDAPISSGSYSFAPDDSDSSGFSAGPYYFQIGDVSGAQYAQDFSSGYRVKLNSVPLSTGSLVRPDAKALLFKAPVGAAKTRPAEEKLAERVSVWDYMTDAMKEDVIAGLLSVDCGPAFQAAFDACSGRGQSSLTTGRKLHVPAGRILVSTKAVWNWRSTDSVDDAGDRRKLTIEGDGAANTVIFSTVNGDYAFEVKGYATGGGAQDGTHLDLTIRGFTITQRNNNRTGGGIKINNVSRLRMVDVNSQYFNIGAELFDCINVKLEFCDFSGNNLGLRGGNGGFSNPNLWRVANTSFGGCQIKGVELARSANVSFDTCGFEGIGTSNDINSGFYAAHIINGPSEGGASISFVNCYFEGNNTSADIRAEWGDSNNGTIKVDMCSFNRVDSAIYARRHILFSQVGGGKLFALLTGNVYKNLGSYNGSDPCWEIASSDVMVDMRGEEYAPSCRPKTNGIPVVGGSYSILSVVVQANGSYDLDPDFSTNVSSVEKTANGVYRIYYRVKPRDPLKVVPTSSLINSSGNATVSNRSSNYIEVTTLDSSDNSSDKTFSLNVVGSF